MIYNDIRLIAVERFKTLDLQYDHEFQELIKLASDICNAPIAMLMLIDEDTLWLRARRGIDVEALPRKGSFCSQTLEYDETMVVPNAIEDERFATNAIVASDPNIRFYAGAPLITQEGYKVGTLCVVDVKPQEITQFQQLMLKMLSKQAVSLMEFRISVEMLELNKIEVDRQKEIIKKANIRLRSFFESSPNFHVLLGKNGEVIDFNKAAYSFVKKIYGIKMTRGSMFISFLDPDFASKFTDGYQSALRGEKAFQEGSTNYDAHNTIYWEASFETARDTNNKIVGISYIIRDVTDRKIKELKIIDQNKSLLKIAHLQAHQFRAPLTTIIGMLSLIKEDGYEPNSEYYKMLENAANNLDQKIREIVSNVDTMVL